MCVLLILLGLGLAAVEGAPSAKPLNPFKIVGGNETSIEHYPYLAKIQITEDFENFSPGCAAIIVNNMSLLTAANCVRCFAYIQLRVRVGSNNTYFGGAVYKVKKYVTLEQTPPELRGELNLAILRLTSPIVFNKVSQPAPLAEPDYLLGDNEMVWSSGWGPERWDGWAAKQLRHVQTWTVNQAECRKRYAYYDMNITEVMLCAGWLDVGHRGICWDQGGALVHNGVVVGMNVAPGSCGSKFFPDIYARITTARKWIDANS